ncbi:hypothetical protein ACWNXI_04670 [Caldibacillus thermoamylovorans]
MVPSFQAPSFLGEDAFFLATGENQPRSRDDRTAESAAQGIEQRSGFGRRCSFTGAEKAGETRLFPLTARERVALQFFSICEMRRGSSLFPSITSLLEILALLLYEQRGGKERDKYGVLPLGQSLPA